MMSEGQDLAVVTEKSPNQCHENLEVCFSLIEQ